jgi:hypothetical protein
LELRRRSNHRTADWWSTGWGVHESDGILRIARIGRIAMIARIAIIGKLKTLPRICADGRGLALVRPLGGFRVGWLTNLVLVFQFWQFWQFWQLWQFWQFWRYSHSGSRDIILRIFRLELSYVKEKIIKNH